MFGKKYQWLIAGVYPAYWWLEPGCPCPVKHLIIALKGAIVMETTPLSTTTTKTALNVVSTFEEYVLTYSSVHLMFRVKYYSEVITAAIRPYFRG